jgi:hypothetical protein
MVPGSPGGRLMAVAQRDFMFLGKIEELIPVYPVLSAGQPESYQIAFFNPP